MLRCNTAKGSRTGVTVGPPLGIRLVRRFCSLMIPLLIKKGNLRSNHIICLAKDLFIFFFPEFCSKFITFLRFFSILRWKLLFQPVFGVRSTQTLVEIYNILLFIHINNAFEILLFEFHLYLIEEELNVQKLFKGIHRKHIFLAFYFTKKLPPNFVL